VLEEAFGICLVETDAVVTTALFKLFNVKLFILVSITNSECSAESLNAADSSLQHLLTELLK